MLIMRSSAIFCTASVISFFFSSTTYTPYTNSLSFVLYNICKYKSVYSVKNIINWVIAFSYTP
nr:MAG TPA: hypothetical protein [Bacteriophage sp.]